MHGAQAPGFLSRPRVQDAILTALALAVSLTYLAVTATHAGPVVVSQVLAAVGIAAIAALSLIVRRDRPILVVAVTVGAEFLVVMIFGANDKGLTLMSACVAFYSCGRYLPPRSGWPVGVVAALVYSYDIPPQAIVVYAIVLIAIGQSVRARWELDRRRHTETAAEAVHIERRRIARELHDVVAHHISVMNLLIGAARTTRDPDSSREALLGAELAGREAMAEMRGLLDILRADDAEDSSSRDGAAVRSPDALDALVARARETGLSAELLVVGEQRSLSAAVDLAVYRIVQESLTNVRKHGQGGRASVRLTYGPSTLDVEIVDDAMSVRRAGVGGHGLAGMAERVALCGGTFEAGPRPQGGFRVFAGFPLPSSVPEKEIS
ncbi:ATPase [Planotetraspora silvatica]|uniref:histidine kinase n=1 Tax=Planotetraspora silvatica TaxID=234614 RepID=A0A8J3UR25_9ACTN|nr:histidine kinase [Planotetraspora silvatica]GII49106.1 ATPase [Planotetraspora silvatica]